MATYKVPQDVEAEDKLIGFLSLKQFIFVLVMIGALWMCWVLAKVNILFGIVPLPIAFVSGILGLYQRKDQPVEVYLASWLRFKTKPRIRKWDQEGLAEHVIITVPKQVIKTYTNGLNQQQVASRLNQLSALMDTRGWASKQGGTFATQAAMSQSYAQAIAPQPQVQSQRLFSMQELSRYAKPSLPIDTDVLAMQDPYENDPRSRTSQQVDRDFKIVSERQHQSALDVVEQARRAAAESYESTATTQPVAASAPTAPLVQTPLVATPPPANTQQTPVSQSSSSKNIQTKEQPATTDTSVKEDGEVVIDLHNTHKKA